MKRIDYTTGCKMLREAGCTTREVERLSKLRSGYREQEMDSAIATRFYREQNSLLRRVIDRMLDICQIFATSGDMYWMHDQNLF